MYRINRNAKSLKLVSIELDTVPYAVVATVAHKLNDRKHNRRIVASKGRTIISYQERPISDVEVLDALVTVLEEKGITGLKIEQKNIRTWSCNSENKEFNSYWGRLLSREIQNTLINHGYIPDTWLRDNRTVVENIYLIPKANWISSRVLNPSLGDYRAYRCLRLRVKVDKNLVGCIIADIETRLRKDKTLWDSLNDTLKAKGITLDDVRQDPKLQREINGLFWRWRPGLTTTYSLQREGGDKYTRYRFRGFDFDHFIDDPELAFDWNGRKVTILEYHEANGRTVEPRKQIVVKAAIGTKEYQLPPSLARETTDMRTLERVGASRDALLKAKISPMDRIIILALQLKPLFDEGIINPVLRPVESWTLGQAAYLIAGNKSITLTEKKTNLFAKNKKIHAWEGISSVFILLPDSTIGSRVSGVQTLSNELEKTLNAYCTANNSPKITMTNDKYKGNDTESQATSIVKRVKAFQTDDPSQYLVIIFFNDASDTEGTLRAQIKGKLTLMKEVPTQFVKLSTIDKTLDQLRDDPNAMKYLAMMLAFQGLVKLRNVPYILSLNKDYPETVFIGLDRSYDTHGDRPSVSGGVAAFGTTGEFIAGASSTLSSDMGDEIPIASLVQQLLPKIKKKKPNTQTIVVLRDGGVGTRDLTATIDEVKEILEEKNIKLIFLTTNKSSNVRVFNFDLDPALDATALKYLNPLLATNKYPVRTIAVIKTKYKSQLKTHLGINSPDLQLKEPTCTKDPFNPENAFILVTTKLVQMRGAGTQRPLHYEIHKNTTDLNPEETIEMLASCLSGLCFTVWESLVPTRLPSPLHYAHKLAKLCSQARTPWKEETDVLSFI